MFDYFFRKLNSKHNNLYHYNKGRLLGIKNRNILRPVIDGRLWMKKRSWLVSENLTVLTIQCATERVTHVMTHMLPCAFTALCVLLLLLFFPHQGV